MREDEVLAVIEGGETTADDQDQEVSGGRLLDPTRQSGEHRQWQSRLCTASSRGRPFCAASTSWPTR